jgi:hypothetical protein
MANSSQPIPLNFSDSRLFGILDEQGAYDFAITATNPSGGNVSADLVVKAAEPRNDQALQIALVLAIAAGGVCLAGFFYAGYRYLKNKRQPENRSVLLSTMYGALEDEENEARELPSMAGERGDENILGTEVVTPIARAIVKQVKILGGTDKKNTPASTNFKGAVKTLLTELSAKGVDIQIDRMRPAQRNALIHEIAVQTKRHLVGQSASSRRCFFQPSVSSEDLKQEAAAIAASVAEIYSARYEEAADPSTVGAMSDPSAIEGERASKLPPARPFRF